MSESHKHAPLGSQYEKLYPRKHKRKRNRSQKKLTRRRKIRIWITNKFEEFSCMALPPLYNATMRLIWATSRTHNNYDITLDRFIPQYGGLIAILWHQEVLTAPHIFRKLRVHTLTSISTLGRLVTALLEKNQFKVFRGGRHHKIVLKDMIQYMGDHPEIVYGITVDGSRGPARKMKRGACMLAKGNGAPIFIVTTRTKHSIFLPTWDKTVFPLPFNRIETHALGPYWIAPDCSNETFDQFCEHMERELLNLTDYIDRLVKDGRIDPRTRSDFPPNWQSDWSENQIGTPLSEWDLQTENAPPWTSIAKTAPACSSQ